MAGYFFCLLLLIQIYLECGTAGLGGWRRGDGRADGMFQWPEKAHAVLPLRSAVLIFCVLLFSELLHNSMSLLEQHSRLPNIIKYERTETDNGNRATNVLVDSPPSEARLNMKSERDRLKTFEGWPCIFMDPKDLAKAGFYYIHLEDVVRCAFCRVEIGRWEAGDNAMTDHQRWSSNCPFISGVDVGNVPLDPNDTITITRASQDTCGRYGIEIRPNSVAERTESASTELSKLGINQHRGPVYPNYSTKEARLRTFKEWPKSMRQTSDELSEAGFFYTGKGDQTVCFSCGGGLKDWDQSDDPWEQHAKWFSKCSFVSMVKGRSFIQDVASRLEPIITTEQGAQVESAASTSQLPEKTEKPSTSAPLQKKKTQEPINDGRLCKICYAEELGVVFLPCGHIVACVKCAPSLSTCAVCRQPFAATVRAFLS